MDKAAEKTAGDRYQSGTSFNFREFILMTVVCLGLVLCLAVPVLIVMMDKWSGLDFDTYKEIPADATPGTMLPTGDASSIEVEEDGAAATYEFGSDGQGTFIVLQLANGQAAIAAWKNIHSRSASQGVGKHIARGIEDEKPFIAWVNGPYLFQLKADNDSALLQLAQLTEFASLPGDPEYGVSSRPFMARVMMSYSWLFVLAIDLLITLFMWGIFAGGLAIAVRKPKRGVDRQSREAMRDALLALNDPDSPFVIEEVAPFHLMGRWKLDVPDYSTLFSMHGLSELYQLDLYIHRSSSVCVLETRGSVAWDASLVPPKARYNWSVFRGVVLYEYKMHKEYVFEPGTLKFKKVVDYTFDSEEFKRPVVETIIGMGWTYRPVLLKPLRWHG